MIICRDQGRLPSHVTELRLNGELVVYTNIVRNLGMLVDSRLSFQEQSNDIRTRVSRLWHFADVTPVLTRKQLVQSLIVPYFLYCDVIYSLASAGACYIYGVSRFQSILSHSCQILGVSLNDFYDFMIFA
jgi:hypothetical protein